MSYTGSLREISLGKETTRGTAVASASGSFLRHTGHSIKDVNTPIAQNGADGTIVETHIKNKVQSHVAGQIPFQLEVDNAYLLGYAICGQAPTTTGAGPYVHTFDFDHDSNTHQSFTINYSDPVTGDRASALGMFNTITVETTADNYVSCAFDMLGKASASASFTPSYKTTPDFFVPSELSLDYATNYAGLSSATSVALKSFTLNVEKNLAPQFEPTLQEILNQRTTVTGSFVLRHNADTFRTLALSDGVRALRFTVSNGTQSFRVILPSVSFDEFDPSTDNSAIVDQTITFEADNLDATNGLIEVIATDSTSNR